MEFLINSIGLIGTSLIVLGYFLIQTGKIKAENIWFININFIGSLLLAISLLYSFNLASFILELIWMSIGLYGYYNYFKNKK